MLISSNTLRCQICGGGGPGGNSHFLSTFFCRRQKDQMLIIRNRSKICIYIGFAVTKKRAYVTPAYLLPHVSCSFKKLFSFWSPHMSCIRIITVLYKLLRGVHFEILVHKCRQYFDTYLVITVEPLLLSTGPRLFILLE